MPNQRAPGQLARSFSMSEEELDRLRAESERLLVSMSEVLRRFIATLPPPKTQREATLDTQQTNKIHVHTYETKL